MTHNSTSRKESDCECENGPDLDDLITKEEIAAQGRTMTEQHTRTVLSTLPQAKICLYAATAPDAQCHFPDFLDCQHMYSACDTLVVCSGYSYERVDARGNFGFPNAAGDFETTHLHQRWRCKQIYDLAMEVLFEHPYPTVFRASWLAWDELRQPYLQERHNERSFAKYAELTNLQTKQTFKVFYLGFEAGEALARILQPRSIKPHTIVTQVKDGFR